MTYIVPWYHRTADTGTSSATPPNISLQGYVNSPERITLAPKLLSQAQLCTNIYTVLDTYN